MPTEFGLAPLLTAQGAVGRLAVHSEQYVVKGTRFLPFEGTVRFARFHLEPFLPQHDVSSVMFQHLHCQHRNHSGAVYKPGQCYHSHEILSLCWPQKAYGGVEVYFRKFLTTSAIGRRKWSATRPGRFTSGEGMFVTKVGALIVATIYLQLIQKRYTFRSFTVLQYSHQHCVQPVASDVEVVGYL